MTRAEPVEQLLVALLVDRLADRLAHVRVGERLAPVVHPERELAVGRALVDDVVGVVLQRPDEVGVDAGQDVDVARREGVDGGVGIGEVLERDTADRRRLAPVGVVAGKGDRRPDVPLDERERPRAVGRVLQPGGVGLQHGARPPGHAVGEVVVRLAERDDDRGVVGCLDRGDAARRSASLAPSARWASSDHTTSADVSGSPLWNVTPSRSVNVYTVPSSETSGSRPGPARSHPRRCRSAASRRRCPAGSGRAPLRPA